METIGEAEIASDIVGKWYFRTPENHTHFASDAEVFLTFLEEGRVLMEVFGQPSPGHPAQARIWSQYHLDDSFSPVRMDLHSFETPEYSPDFEAPPLPAGSILRAIIEFPHRDTLRICGGSQVTSPVYPQQFGPDTADFKRIG